MRGRAEAPRCAVLPSLLAPAGRPRRSARNHLPLAARPPPPLPSAQGAPYAYTPFCDNNKEMDEFRFWKGGFWHSHLQGKPYHISALYLVDLKKFRASAAGDQLR